jgi:hypothetical protein
VTIPQANAAEMAASLPDSATATVRTSNDTYGLVSAAEPVWQEYVSSSIDAGAAAEATVAFEVPESVVSSFGVSATVPYVASGT